MYLSSLAGIEFDHLEVENFSMGDLQRGGKVEIKWIAPRLKSASFNFQEKKKGSGALTVKVPKNSKMFKWFSTRYGERTNSSGGWVVEIESVEDLHTEVVEINGVFDWMYSPTPAEV